MSDPIDLSGARRVGVVSDTHGLVRPELYEFLDGVDAILHAGDLGSDTIEIELSPIAPFYAVAGNVDGFSKSTHPRWRTFQIGNQLAGMTHVALGTGRGKRTLVESAERFCREHVIDLLIFGHTHEPLWDPAHRPQLLNPGSCGPRRFSLPVSMAVIEIDRGGAMRVKTLGWALP